MKDTVEEDPIIDRVREVRREISARFDHDPDKLTAYYIERQARHADRLIYADPKRKPESAPSK